MVASSRENPADWSAIETPFGMEVSTSACQARVPGSETRISNSDAFTAVVSMLCKPLAGALSGRQ